MMQLRPYQKEAVAAVLNRWNNNEQKTLVVLPTGCHGIGEKLLLSDGSIKNVEDILPWERLMGSDGTPRKIIKIHKGKKPLYKIIPIKGTPFIVTEDHMLTLWRTQVKSIPKYPSQEPCKSFIDITVKDYLKKSKYFKHVHKLIRVGVNRFDNSNQGVPLLDPYFVGVLLGDGGITKNINVTTPDTEIVDIIKSIADKYDCKIRTAPAGQAMTYYFTSGNKGTRNKLKTVISKIGLYGHNSGSKFIPNAYKTGTHETRLQVLAGLMDTDGSLRCGVYDFISKSERLAEDTAYIARSVGLAAYVRTCEKSCGEFTGQYYRVSISGNCSIIPCRVKRKICNKRKQKKNVLLTGFTVEKLGIGEYVGFTVDGDNRYLLSDFTVTHNCGKTITFAKIAEQKATDGNKVLILAHRDELLEQAKDKIFQSTGIFCAKEKANETCIDSMFPITVGSVQTMQNDKRLNRFPSDFFSTIIVDEAHHALAKSYQKILTHFPDANVLGVTATPERNNISNLGEYFDSIAYEYPLQNAIRDGYLCKIKAQMIPLSLDISKVTMSQGDYSTNALGTALDPYLEEIASEMEAYRDRKTVVFLPLVATAKKFKLILSRHGFNAAEVDGDSKNRAEILRDFEKGKYNVLCNAMLLTEGWDCPSVDCVVMLRPTKIRALYCQCIGRGTRPAPGKEDLLILDFLWNTQKHDLCRPASLISKSPDVVKKSIKVLEKQGGEMDLEDLEKTSSDEVIEERENALAEQLKAMKHAKRKLVDPLQYAFSIQSRTLVDYKPEFAWECKKPTEKQIQAIQKFGIFPDEINKGQAVVLLDELIKRSENHLATPKQIRFLESRGFIHVGQWKFDDASKMIGRYASNGWMTPRGIRPSEYEP